MMMLKFLEHPLDGIFDANDKYPIAMLQVQKAQHLLQGDQICEDDDPIVYSLIDTDNTLSQLTLLQSANDPWADYGLT